MFDPSPIGLRDIRWVYPVTDLGTEATGAPRFPLPLIAGSATVYTCCVASFHDVDVSVVVGRRYIVARHIFRVAIDDAVSVVVVDDGHTVGDVVGAYLGTVLRRHVSADCQTSTSYQVPPGVVVPRRVTLLGRLYTPTDNVHHQRK